MPHKFYEKHKKDFSGISVITDKVITQDKELKTTPEDPMRTFER